MFSRHKPPKCQHHWEIISWAHRRVETRDILFGSKEIDHFTDVVSQCTECGTLKSERMRGTLPAPEGLKS